VSEPTRWLKDGRAPREVLEVLESMSPPKPAPPSVHHKLAARFADAGSGGSIHGSLFGAKLARLFAGVAIGGGVVFAAVRGPLARKPPAPPAESSENAIRAPAPRNAEEPTSRTNLAPATEPTPAADSARVEGTGGPSASVAPNGAPSRAMAASPRHAAGASPSADTLAEEESILEGARRAMATSPAQALRLLAAHQRRFPAGELTAERLFLRTDALKRLGRTAEARRQADALVKRFPTSAYARLVPQLVAAPAP